MIWTPTDTSPTTRRHHGAARSLRCSRGIRMRGAGESLALASVLFVACEEVPRTYSTRGNSGTEIFRDDFERTELGASWKPTAEGAWIEHGVLKLKDVRNHPLWLDVALP